MAAHETAGQPRLRVLLVEDDFSAGEALRRLIHRAGHEVHLASGLADVRALAASERFDLLISDFYLSDAIGSDILAEVARRSVGVIAVALSGSTDEAERANLQAAGFAYYFSKPVDWPQLRSVIERINRDRRAGLPRQEGA
ncbi:MAG: response regulator [Verrucomicrobia bacterium]|nr:response regulator [Verrucomicrobiota bacterium]